MNSQGGRDVSTT